MDSNISLETALHLLGIAYVVSMMLVIGASNLGLTIITTLEESGK